MTCPIQKKLTTQVKATKNNFNSHEKWYVWVSDFHGIGMGVNPFFNALNAINDECKKGLIVNAIFPRCRDSVGFSVCKLKDITLIKKDFLCHQQQIAKLLNRKLKWKSRHFFV